MKRMTDDQTITWNAGAVYWRGLRLRPTLHGRRGLATASHDLAQAQVVAADGGLRLAVVVGGWQVHLDLCVVDGWLAIDGSLASSGTDAQCGRLTWAVSGGDLAAADLRCWGLPYDTWGRQIVGTAVACQGEAAPWWRSVWHRPAGDALAVAWHLPADWLHRATWSEGILHLETILDCVPATGELLRLDRLAIHPAIAPHLGLVGAPGMRVSRRRAAEAADHGAWSSWDYHRLAVDAAGIREHLAFLAERPVLRQHVRYIVIDDGWQTGTGDWEVAGNFPEGMAGIARWITAAGFVPGIWSAPFFADLHSRVAQEHPDWLVRKHGLPYAPFAELGCTPPWGDRGYLDPTHPAVADHIFQLYRRIRSWGYRYFKTDFLVNPFRATFSSRHPDLAGVLRFHDRGAGLHRGHRRCMQAIRAAIGEESFWLGCGAVWSTGAGLLDAARTSGDIDTSWPAARHCAESVLRCGPMHGELWLNDPDFLVVRGPSTSSRMFAPAEGLAGWRSASHGRTTPGFTPDEARTWATCVALGGGVVVLSDGLPQLNAEGLGILETACRLAGGTAARPVDLDADRPSVLLAERAAGPLLAVINWQDAPATACPASLLPLLPQRTWTDAWTGRPHATGDLPGIVLPAHSSLLLT